MWDTFGTILGMVLTKYVFIYFYSLMSGNKTIYQPINSFYETARKRIKIVDLSLITTEEQLWKQDEIFLRKQQQLLAGSA